MSRKRSRKGGSPAGRTNRSRLTRRSAAAALAACLALAGAAAAWWAPVRRTPPQPAATQPAAAPQANLSLSKEYVYADGRLVATEEPAAGPPPTGLVATASSQTAVGLTWAAPASGAVAGYVVERRESVGGSPTLLPTGGTAATFTDSQVSTKTAYLYRVRAVFAGGGTSDYSNADLATTVLFDDDPLVAAGNPSGATPTKVAAKHLTQLREAVEAVRALVPGLGAAAWKNDPGPASGGLILPAHFKELRTNLNQALSALGLGQFAADDAAFVKGQLVRAAHVQEVRDRVK